MTIPDEIKRFPLKDYPHEFKFVLEDHAMMLIEEAVFKDAHDLYETFVDYEGAELNDTLDFIIKEMIDASFVAMETAQTETFEKYKDELFKTIYVAQFDE